MKGSATSWLVTGLGAVVTGVGTVLPKGRLRTATISFGLAHVALGVADMLRPSVRQ